jgi:hypothetical protein
VPAPMPMAFRDPKAVTLPGAAQPVWVWNPKQSSLDQSAGDPRYLALQRFTGPDVSARAQAAFAAAGANGLGDFSWWGQVQGAAWSGGGQAVDTKAWGGALGGGLTLVGEQGPELITGGHGAHVRSTGWLRQALRDAAGLDQTGMGGSGVTLNLTINAPGATAESVAAMKRDLVPMIERAVNDMATKAARRVR